MKIFRRKITKRDKEEKTKPLNNTTSNERLKYTLIVLFKNEMGEKERKANPQQHQPTNKQPTHP